MRCDIILAGVGGQGILTIATVFGYAAVESGLYLKQSEVHGMSQRGGAVQSHLRMADRKIFSDLVPAGGADLIVSVEPMEALRYLSYLAEKGWIVTNTAPYINIPDYPDNESLMETIDKLPRHIAFDADKLAKDTGNPRGMNMAIAGAASLFVELPVERMEEAIRVIFARKGDGVVEKNLETFRTGRRHADSIR
jgi:indolepyruvate ferredoxin oxidoreductase beta subunit